MKFLIVFSSFLATVSARYVLAVDTVPPVSEQTLKCLKTNSIYANFVRVYNPDANNGQGGFDEAAIETVNNTIRAGMIPEIYAMLSFTSSKKAYQQVDEIYNGMMKTGHRLSTLWIQVAMREKWSTIIADNVAFIQAAVNRAKQYGLRVGIYTERLEWDILTGNYTGIGRDVLLWYWLYNGYGNKNESPANFDDFVGFGPWAVPAVKQYGEVEQICGISVNRDVYQ